VSALVALWAIVALLAVIAGLQVAELVTYA